MRCVNVVIISPVGMHPKMRTGSHESGKPRCPRWQALVIFLAIFALAVSLATRTFQATTSHGARVVSNSAQASRQRLDRDAAKWIPPVRVLTILQAPIFYPSVAPSGPTLPNVLFDENLSIRPPPSC